MSSLEQVSHPRQQAATTHWRRSLEPDPLQAHALLGLGCMAKPMHPRKALCRHVRFTGAGA